MTGESEKVLICGAGNLLLSDEGFGVHFIRHLERHYVFPDFVELLDAGTLGILITHKIEDAGCVYLVDCIQGTGAPPGSFRRYAKEDFLLDQLPIKLSPHQIGLQEMLVLCGLRGRCPEKVFLLGLTPESLAPGTELTPALQQRLQPLADILVKELKDSGLEIRRRSQYAIN